MRVISLQEVFAVKLPDAVAFARLGSSVPWVTQLRAEKNIEASWLGGLVSSARNVRTVPPVGHVEKISLLRGAAALPTDSSGQKEANSFRLPCVPLRHETEWVETGELGSHRLAGTDESGIVAAAGALPHPSEHPDVYGDGRAPQAIVGALEARYIS